MTYPHYLWIGKDARGHWVKGRATAERASTLHALLRKQRIRVCLCLRSPLWLSAWLTEEGQQQRALATLRATDITRLSRQLTTLLHAGLPLLQSLRLMQQGATPPAYSQLLQKLAAHIEAGQALNEAMRRYPVFDSTFCHLIAAGEHSGQLDVILARLATHRENTHALQARLRSALTYPTIVVCMGVVVSGLLLGFVVPTFEQTFHQMGAELPVLTQWVLRASRALTTHGPELTAIVGLGIWALRHALTQTLRGQRLRDAWRLRLPIWKTLTQHAQCARWCRTLSTLLSAGIPIHEALQQLTQVMDHRAYQAATQDLQQRITQGHALSQSLNAYPHLFDPMLVQMCAVGEESGTLDTLLARLAEHHEAAVDDWTQRLGTLIEPSLMVILGVTIGTLVLAMYWPLFEIGQAL